MYLYSAVLLLCTQTAPIELFLHRPEWHEEYRRQQTELSAFDSSGIGPEALLKAALIRAELSSQSAPRLQLGFVYQASIYHREGRRSYFQELQIVVSGALDELWAFRLQAPPIRPSTEKKLHRRCEVLSDESYSGWWQTQSDRAAFEALGCGG